MSDPGAAAGFRSGFVTILGRPNAGKSTLLNALAGAKLAITSEKPQTTRTSIQGVVSMPDAQIVFIDTPGIHKADSAINRQMMEAVRTALEDRDVLIFLVDAARDFGEADAHALDLVKKAGTPAILALNKIDLLRDKSRLLSLIDRYRGLHDFADYIPISAHTGENLEKLRQAIAALLPEGPAYFPAEHMTDQPERFLAAELVREKILDETHEEVPHAVAVVVDKWEETPRLIRIFATIYVEKEGQKGILLGAGGSKLKRIGSRAREEMEKFFARKIFLDLHVKVHPGWREERQFLDALDWRTMAGKDDS
ncbi:MAG TPA: GTPase Era [Bryobacteraceae bacterium]|nr:GTPase Era [Bryobacteraceae bacterium]